MTKEQKIIAAVSAAIIVSIAMFLWRADVACSVPRHRVALRIGDAAGCFEFWLNRYQTAWAGLIGAGVALFAARLAWGAVQAQISAQVRANVLNQIAMTRTRISEVSVELEQIETALKNLQTAVQYREKYRGNSARPFSAAATLLKREGLLPFDRVGPSQLSPVNRTDELLARIDRLFGQKSPSDEERQHELLGQQFNTLATLEKPLSDAKSKAQTAKMDAVRTLREIEVSIG